MRTKNEILVDHYVTVMRKMASWLGLGAILGSMLLPAAAGAAGQLTARKALVTSSLPSASSTYTVNFTLATAGQTLGSVKFEICDSPLSSVSCVGSGGSVGAAFISATYGSMTGFGGAWSANAGTAASGASGTSIVFKKAVAAVEAGTPSGVAVINVVTNPSTANTQYYLRISTYTDLAATAPAYPGTDFGGLAMSTSQSMAVNATVQEMLKFCVATTVGDENCGSPTGATVSLSTGGGGCPILGTGNTCTGTSMMAASTNANTGYSITYNGTTFAGPNDVITEVGDGGVADGGAAVALGTKQFGMKVAAAGTGSAIATTDYDFDNSKYSYKSTDATQSVATAAGATTGNLFTTTYMANVSATTKPGQYQATLTYICTGTF